MLCCDARSILCSPVLYALESSADSIDMVTFLNHGGTRDQKEYSPEATLERIVVLAAPCKSRPCEKGHRWYIFSTSMLVSPILPSSLTPPLTSDGQPARYLGTPRFPRTPTAFSNLSLTNYNGIGVWLANSP